MEQRSEEWFAARCGKLTSSRIGDAMARVRNGWGASRETLKATMAVERLTGVVEQTYINAAMQWGIDHEDEARAFYSMMQNVEVTEVPWVLHPNLPMSGASPDGIVNDKGRKGLVEIKCPTSSNHIKTLRSQKIDKRYEKQMLWQLACVPDAEFVDFVSYDPRMPEELMLSVARWERDIVLIGDLELEASVFLTEVDVLVTELKEMADARNK